MYTLLALKRDDRKIQVFVTQSPLQVGFWFHYKQIYMFEK